MRAPEIHKGSRETISQWSSKLVAYAKLWQFVRAMIVLGRRGTPYDAYSPGEFMILHYPPDRCFDDRTAWKVAGRLSQKNLELFIKGFVLAEESGMTALPRWHRELSKRETENQIWASSWRGKLQISCYIRARKLQRLIDKQDVIAPNVRKVLHQWVGRIARGISTLLRVGGGRTRVRHHPVKWGDEGSTTKVPHLLHPYAIRFGFDNADKVAAWCRENSTKGYAPFAFLDGDSLSCREWLKRQDEATIKQWTWHRGNALRKELAAQDWYDSHPH